MLNSFHGRTHRGPERHRAAEVPSGRRAAPGRVSLRSLRRPASRGQKLIDAETCAILVEPIQGEGGVNLPPAGYLEGLRQLADQHQLMLIFDEVQTGMGRTGNWFGYQHWDVVPDAVTLAKALGGGVAIGGLMARPAFAQKLVPGTHAATFGGNPLACRAALAAIETIEKDGLLARAVPHRRALPANVSRPSNRAAR